MTRVSYPTRSFIQKDQLLQLDLFWKKRGLVQVYAGSVRLNAGNFIWALLCQPTGPRISARFFNKYYCSLLDCKIKQVVPIGEHLTVEALWTLTFHSSFTMDPLERTVRRIRYHPTSQTNVTVTAVPDPFILKEDSTTATQDSVTAGANTEDDASNDAVAVSTTPATATANGTADLNGSMKAISVGPGFRPLSDSQT